jgi:peptide/nickel transport system substrate-binding protein
MKRWFIVSTVAIAMIILLSPCTPQAASPAPSTTEKAATSSSKAKPATSAKASVKAATTTAAQPQTGGIWKVLIKSASNVFGYPPSMSGAARDYAPPFFNFLLSIGADGKFKPQLATSWDTSKDGKNITFKLRRGVTFHDGTAFNAQAVKFNLDNLIPPNPVIIAGIASVDVVDDYTVKVNLSNYNNLILYSLASNPACYMYSPEAFKKNGKDWAVTHPVGTGPFMLKDYQPNVSLTLVKNPNYWEKDLPYLDGMEIRIVIDPTTQMITFKAGQAEAIYDVAQTGAAQLRDAGYSLQMATGTLQALSFDAKNSEYFSNPKVRQAMEYAIDKEAICKGPGAGLCTPAYQMVSSSSPDYNKSLTPRKYDPAKAKKLLAEAGYPNGFSCKVFIVDNIWLDGYVAAQDYLGKVGIKMDINYVNASAYNLIRVGGKIEPGAMANTAFIYSSNTLYTLDLFLRTNSASYPYIVKPAGIDNLIDEAKLSRNPAAVTKINQQVLKLLCDDATIIPLWQTYRIAVVDKSVQNTGWFVYDDPNNNEFGTRTWLKK